MVSQAIAQGDVQAINYFVAQKYVEALKEFAASPNQKVFMMPMESAGLLGALGGIAELAKDAMQRQPSSLPPGSPGAARTTAASAAAVSYFLTAPAVVALDGARRGAGGRRDLPAGRRRHLVRRVRGRHRAAAGRHSDSLAVAAHRLCACSASSRCCCIAAIARAIRQIDEQPNLNQRGLQYVGSELVLVEPIAQGSGKAKLGDGVWKVSGPELPAGARVRVTGVNGTILTVIPA